MRWLLVPVSAAVFSASPLVSQPVGVDGAPGARVDRLQCGPVVAQAPNPAAPDPAASDRAAMVAERHELFMLAAMAYLAVEWKARPEVGGPIAAIVAWDVADTSKTPRFVIDRNRNRVMEDGTYHAEMSAIHAAYRAKPKGVRWKGWLKNTTLYTTLEPCIMCAATMPVQHVPRAEFCMDDPSIRATDKPGRPRVYPVPSEYHGRTFAMHRSSLGRCAELNEVIWRRVDGARENGGGEFRFFTYLRKHVDAVFGPSVGDLATRKAQYSGNAELLEKLKAAALGTER